MKHDCFYLLCIILFSINGMFCRVYIINFLFHNAFNKNSLNTLVTFNNEILFIKIKNSTCPIIKNAQDVHDTTFIAAVFVLSCLSND